jgi:hypothetical protein
MPRKKRRPIEYRIFILPTFGEPPGRAGIVIRLETVAEFANFSYEIAVDELVIGNKIIWNIRGLRSPEISLPASGPAVFSKSYENVRGEVELTIKKRDGTENVFALEIDGDEISVLRSPKQKFVELVRSMNARVHTPKHR